MGVDVTYDLGAIRKLAKKYPVETRIEMTDTMHDIVNRLEALVVKGTPAGVSGEGGLRGSIAGEVVTMGQEVRGTVGTPLEYGKVIEYGRRPGKAMPPVAPIALWARRKLGVSEEESRGVGFVIARKIAVEGFEGAHMFEKAWKEVEPWAQKQLMGIADRVIRRIEG